MADPLYGGMRKSRNPDGDKKQFQQILFNNNGDKTYNGETVLSENLERCGMQLPLLRHTFCMTLRLIGRAPVLCL